MKTARFLVAPGDRRALRRLRPDSTDGLSDKHKGGKHLEAHLARLTDLQQKLYAQGRHAWLVVLQGMDTAGKDSAIRHVFAGFNPETITVHNFKRPSSEELKHDFL